MSTSPDVRAGSTGLGRVDYSRAPQAVYFVASTGDRWRVHDCAMEDGRLVRLGLPANPCATHRVFVASTKVKKVYTRLAREVWRCTPAQLDRQLLAAEYLATAPSDPGARRVR